LEALLRPDSLGGGEFSEKKPFGNFLREVFGSKRRAFF
jgi:hypothetical protein